MVSPLPEKSRVFNFIIKKEKSFKLDFLFLA